MSKRAVRKLLPAELATVCTSLVEDFERRQSIRALAVALLFGTDPSNGWVVVYPLPEEDLTEKSEEPDLESALNPAEHREELELALPGHIAGLLPKGAELRALVEETVLELRRRYPEKLVYMTDPDCEELLASVASARLPSGLAFIRQMLDDAD